MLLIKNIRSLKDLRAGKMIGKAFLASQNVSQSKVIKVQTISRKQALNMKHQVVKF